MGSRVFVEGVAEQLAVDAPAGAAVRALSRLLFGYSRIGRRIGRSGSLAGCVSDDGACVAATSSAAVGPRVTGCVLGCLWAVQADRRPTMTPTVIAKKHLIAFFSRLQSQVSDVRHPVLRPHPVGEYLCLMEHEVDAAEHRVEDTIRAQACK